MAKNCSCTNGVRTQSTLYDILHRTDSKNSSVSKATLDIICETAFGNRSDSLHNAHNELAEAYDTLTSLQNGKSRPNYSEEF